MTASIAGLGAGEDTLVALRPKRPTQSRDHEWQSVYRHELQRNQEARVEKHLPQNKAPTTASAPSAPSDSEPGPPHMQAVVIAVGGHLELKYVAAASPAGAGVGALDSLAAEALAGGNAHDPTAKRDESPPDARLASAPTRVSIVSRLAGENAVTPQRPIAPAEAGPSQKPSQDPHGTPSDREQVLESVANGGAALTSGALACVPVAPPGRSGDVAQRSGSETPIPLATALTLAASQGLMSLSASTTGSSQDRGQDSQGRQSGSQGAASGGGAGTGGVSHGTFPLIVSGQLMELEFVSLGAGAKAMRGAAQQIVLSVQPPGSPRFELTARKLNGKVAVTVDAPAGASGDGLGGTGLDLPSLLRRLGWGSLPVELTDTGAVR